MGMTSLSGEEKNMNMNCRTKTVEEVARILGIGRNTAYEAVRSGAIPSIRIGKRYVIPVDALDKMLNFRDFQSN